jgi:acyl-CoA dehydrogenase
VVNDAMDILGGKGICLGPNNFMGRAYQQVPVAITVEGANILTRSLIIFGQGAIRCHPYVLKEMAAAKEADGAKGLRDFDKAFAAHLWFIWSRGFRAWSMGLTGSNFGPAPDGVAPETRRYYQQLTRFSAAFAFISDVSMFVMGGDLKRKEKLSARLGDILSLMYLCSATLKRYEAEGRQSEDAPLLHWAIWDAMFKMQNAFEGVISNYPSRIIAGLLHWYIFPIGRPYVVPSDKLGHEVAQTLIEPSATRDRLTAGMYVPRGEDDAVGIIELALEATMAAEPIEARIREARKDGKVGAGDTTTMAAHAREAGIITAEEHALLQRRVLLRDRAIAVDDFPQDFSIEQAAPVTPTTPNRNETLRKVA